MISQEVFLGETILMNVDSLAYFGLDELGSKIWRELNDCDDAQEVFDRIAGAGDYEETKLLQTFRGILSGLEMSKIIRLEPTS